MIDTHCHIYTEEFASDAEQVIGRAQAAGVERIFMPCINCQSIAPMLQLAGQHPGYLYPMMGLHPEDVTDHYLSDLDAMEAMLQQPDHPYIAIGEVGLDLYWDATYSVQQLDALNLQVQWALRYDLPLMIHCRNAHRMLVDALAPYREQLSGVFHCFGGSEAEAAELLEFPHFALGIGGVLTFKKSTLPDVLRSTVPLERVVLETDAPYLAPVPHRGKRNESSFLPSVVARLADVYGTNIAHIEQQTTATALSIFTKATKP